MNKNQICRYALILVMMTCSQLASAQKIIKKTVTYEEVNPGEEPSAEDKFINQLSISIGAHQTFFVAQSDQIKTEPLASVYNKMYTLSMGKNYYGKRIAFEALFIPKINHSYNYRVPYNQKSDNREYELTGWGLNSQSRWLEWEYADIFSGVLLQVVNIRDVSLDNGIIPSSNESDPIVFFTPSLGLNFFPRKALSLSIEARLGIPLTELERKTVKNVNAFGIPTIETKKINLSFASIGINFLWNF